MIQTITKKQLDDLPKAHRLKVGAALALGYEVTIDNVYIPYDNTYLVKVISISVWEPQADKALMWDLACGLRKVVDSCGEFWEATEDTTNLIQSFILFDPLGNIKKWLDRQP